MTKKLTQFDRIDISSPCVTDWDQMKGNDEVRFCQHCNLNVHNLSAMTRSKARRLVRRSKGRLCVRYVRRIDGTIQTASRELYQISRRASRFAAGVFSAALSLSSTALVQAQTTLLASNLGITISEEIKQKPIDGAKASIKGTVVDPNGAAFKNAAVTLIKEDANEEKTTLTNENGEYEFQGLESGIYIVMVKAEGFRDDEVERIDLVDGTTRKLKNTLQVMETVEIVTMGGEISLPAYQNPLLNAASNDYLEGVKEQLIKGINVNTQERGDTALHIAVSRSNVEMIRLLLEAGANPNIRDEGKSTALLMLNEGITEEIIKLLLNAGAKVNVKDEEGTRPLMIAAEFESSEILQALLNAGAKVNRRDNEGRTALMIAVEEGRLENVKALLAAGANVHLKDKTGLTAIMLALENGDEEIINLLRAYGAYEESSRQ